MKRIINGIKNVFHIIGAILMLIAECIEQHERDKYRNFRDYDNFI